VYDGCWQLDQKHGRGSFTCASSGDVYSGEWSWGERDGQATLTQADGTAYEGAYHVGMKEGKGREKYPDGSEYEGDWKAGEKQGKGTCTHADGAVYEGIAYHSKHSIARIPCRIRRMLCYAMLCCATEGEWNGGRQEGRGTIRQPNGDLYCRDPSEPEHHPSAPPPAAAAARTSPALCRIRASWQ
jgi:hypothetical protein